MYLFQSSIGLEDFDEDEYEPNGKYCFVIFKRKPIDYNDHSICEGHQYSPFHDKMLFKFKK